MVQKMVGVNPEQAEQALSQLITKWIPFRIRKVQTEQDLSAG